MLVYLACSVPGVDGNEHRYTSMYETSLRPFACGER